MNDQPGGRGKGVILPAFVSYTLKKEDGSSVEEKKSLYTFDNSFITEPLPLPDGRYSLERFMILNSVEEIMYASPVTGSTMADLVEYPLPLSFNIANGEVVNVVPEVLAVEDHEPVDFGYPTFGFEVMNWNASGLEKFDLAYMAFDAQHLGMQMMSHTRLTNKAGDRLGWIISLPPDKREARMEYRYTESGQLKGVDYVECEQNLEKLLSIEFDTYSSAQKPEQAHLYSWHNGERIPECDIHFTYENGKLASFRKDNFRISPEHPYYVFVNFTFTYSESGNIAKFGYYAEYKMKEEGSNLTQSGNRQYEYDQAPNVFKLEFDLPKAISFFTIHWALEYFAVDDLNYRNAIPADILAAMMSENNYTKASTVPLPNWPPDYEYKRISEHSRSISYDVHGYPVKAYNELVHLLPFDADLGKFPFTIAKGDEFFKVVQ